MTKYNKNVKDCEKLKELYTFYVYEDVSSEEDKLISEHLKICPDCSKEVDSLRNTVNLLKMEHEPVVPQYLMDNFESKIYKRISMQSIESTSNWFNNIINLLAPRRLLLQSAAITVLFIVGIMVGFYELKPIFSPQTTELYQTSLPPAHKRLEQYNQKELYRQWEDAVLTLYVEGDDWDAANQLKRLIDENPGTSFASMAYEELLKTDAFEYAKSQANILSKR